MRQSLWDGGSMFYSNSLVNLFQNLFIVDNFIFFAIFCDVFYFSLTFIHKKFQVIYSYFNTYLEFSYHLIIYRNTPT